MRDYAARKTQLETRLNELDTRIHKIEDRLDDPVTKDWQDQAIEREDTEVLESMGNAGLKEMEMIRAALARIEADTYGDCLKCGAEISDARLDIVPHAALCRDCARGT
jgi:RNA polymerase-binding transcription factor DksA